MSWWLFDHNQAFDFDAAGDDFYDYHVFNCQSCALFSDFVRRTEYYDKFHSALESWSRILTEIPDTWWYMDAEMTVPVDFDTDAVYELLKSFERDDFWSWK